MDIQLKCECGGEIDFICTEDTSAPYGEVISMPIFECKRCGKSYTVYDDMLVEI